MFQPYDDSSPYSLSPIGLKSQRLLRSPRKVHNIIIIKNYIILIIGVVIIGIVTGPLKVMIVLLVYLFNSFCHCYYFVIFIILLLFTGPQEDLSNSFQGQSPHHNNNTYPTKPPTTTLTHQNPQQQQQTSPPTGVGRSRVAG